MRPADAMTSHSASIDSLPPRAESSAFRRALPCLLLAASAGHGAEGLAQTAAPAASFPTRPLRFVVPFAAGGAADVMARTIGAHFASAWGQPAVIDNRSGAGGLIAAEITARAVADGHTLMLAEPALASLPWLHAKPTVDVLRDLAPVAGIASAPQVITVQPSLPVRSVQELVAWGRANPTRFNFGSPSRGSTGDLAGELLRTMTGVNFTVVTYKGAAPALAALAGGEVTFTASSMLAGMPLVKSGRVRAIGTTGAKRHGATPDIPSMAEQGLPGYRITQWWGLVSPRGVPGNVVARITAETGVALAGADLRERLAALYAEPMPMDAQAFGAFIREEVEALGRIIRAAGIKPE
jgi:tripartite-type tricarboxylate transporter receptor subunit TctC